MGLSVAISGGIILTVFMLILLSLPGFVDKMFSIGDITSQVTQHEQEISNTKLSMNYLSQLVGSSKVNFTLNNDGSEKLWNFADFNLFIEYAGAISGKTTQQLSYSGECLGAVPQVGNWCIESISNDVADPKILNSGERANIKTNLNENLASITAIVTVVTDNGVTFTTAVNNVETFTTGDSLDESNEVVLLNPSTTAFTITLPPVSDIPGKHYTIQYIATTGTPVTIDGFGSETINRQATILMEYPYSKLELVSSNSAWFAQYTDSFLPTVKQITVQDDFLSSATTSGGAGVHGTLSWSLTGVNAETALFIDGVVDHAGIKRMGTAGALGDDANIFLANTVTEQTFDADDTFDITWVIRIPTITTVVTRLGLTVTPTSNSEAAAENAMFIFDPASDASWTCRTRSVGGIDESTDSTLDVVAGTWYKLRIVKDGGTIRFLINNVNLCNHSTQIPTSAVIPFASIDTTAAVVRQLDLDYCRLSFTMSGR